MKLVEKFVAIFGGKEGTAFKYRSNATDYRIFIIKEDKGYKWELLENKSSYDNKYEKICDSDEEFFKSENLAKLDALKWKRNYA